MEITEAKIIAYLKDHDYYHTVRFITSDLMEPVGWRSKALDRMIPKVRKLLKIMAKKGSVDQIECGHGYKFRYVPPEEQAERSEQQGMGADTVFAYLKASGFSP